MEATNNSKHTLTQQVETWADKKTMALDFWGLTNRAKLGKQITGGSSVHNEEIKKPEEPKVDELTAHRKNGEKNI